MFVTIYLPRILKLSSQISGRTSRQIENTLSAARLENVDVWIQNHAM